jgi:hypothetical protein
VARHGADHDSSQRACKGLARCVMWRSHVCAGALHCIASLLPRWCSMNASACSLSMQAFVVVRMLLAAAQVSCPYCSQCVCLHCAARAWCCLLLRLTQY